MSNSPMPIDPRQLNPEEFLNPLARVPWFSRLGQSSPRDDQAARIHDWREWPGPESPRVEDLGPRSQAWYDQVMAGAGTRRAEAEALWERIRGAVFEHARDTVPYDPEADSWHGPTLAVWHASWVAGAIGCSILLGHEIPSEALDHWRWLTEGHWPCGYARPPVEDEPVVLMVL
jgi:hypothetical protein